MPATATAKKKIEQPNIHSALTIEKQFSMQEIRAANRYLQCDFASDMSEYGGFEAFCRLSEATWGIGSQAYVVYADERGIWAVPMMLAHYADPTRTFILGFSFMTQKKVVRKPVAHKGWGDSSEKVVEIMMTARPKL